MLPEFRARFLDLNLTDRSTGHELVLSPQQAGQSLPERLGLRAPQPERVVRPMTLRTDVDVGDGKARIVIPGRRSPALAAAVAVAGISTAPFLARPLLQFFRQTGTPEVVQFAFAGFLALALGILSLLWVVHAVLSAGSRTVVTASRTGILIDWQSVWRRHTRSITAGDIVALDYDTVDSMIDSARDEIERRVRAGARPVAQFSGTPLPPGRRIEEMGAVQGTRREIPAGVVPVRRRLARRGTPVPAVGRLAGARWFIGSAFHEPVTSGWT